MNYALQLSFESPSKRKRHLVVSRTNAANPRKFELPYSELASMLTLLIPPAWEQRFAQLYEQERAIIDTRKQLLAEYSEEFKSIVETHPELLV